MDEFLSNVYEQLKAMHEEVSRSIQGLGPEALDWTPGEEINPMGVLATHISGAERYWIGDVAGSDPSGRDRPAEFRVKNQEASSLQKRLDETLAHSQGVLEKISLENLGELRMSPRDGSEFTVGWSLIHALDHTALHTGQIQIMRQLWDQNIGK